MVGHNNMIPNGHFHKKYQKRIKTWFDQPMKKIRRKKLRAMKHIREAPKPTKRLRPVVHCLSARYNTKKRSGRGFTLGELKHAGINKNFAKTIGISVDHRRKDHSYETLLMNSRRLKEYRCNLILLPSSTKQQQNVVFNVGQDLNKIKDIDSKIKAKRVTEDDKKFEAFVVLRKARSDAKHASKRLKKKLSKADDLQLAMK